MFALASRSRRISSGFMPILARSDSTLRLFSASAHGRALSEAGYGDDLTACAAIDSYPVIPIYQDRQITKLGPERAR